MRVLIFLAATAGSTAAPDAATARAAAVTLTLSKVVVDGRGHSSDPNWTFTDQGGSATYRLAPNQSTCSWTMPASVTAPAPG